MVLSWVEASCDGSGVFESGRKAIIDPILRIVNMSWEWRELAASDNLNRRRVITGKAKTVSSGPLTVGKRYRINGNVLKFVPDTAEE